MERLNRDYDRVTAATKGTVTQEEIDRVVGDRNEARAAVGVALQVRELAKQNVAFTKILSPFSGRIGKRMIDPSNLVKANDTILARLVSLDPINCTFDVDERTLLRLRRLVRDGKIVSARVKPTEVLIGLADEEGYTLTGVIHHWQRGGVWHGTPRLWAKVDNKKLLLSPGMFVRIRLPVGTPKPALLVPKSGSARTRDSDMFSY